MRDYHREIKGVDAQGRRYHALDPDVFYWAHATFFYGTILTAQHFCGGITEQEKRQLFAEHKVWYQQYGVSMRPVPETWEEFQRYWDHMCRDVLEDNKATRDVLDIATIANPVGWLPDVLWSLVRAPVAHGFVWLTVGMYDQPVRDLLGYSWSARDARWHRRVGKAIDAAFRLVPPRLRKHPRARDGIDRVTGRVPVGAPLLETPVRNLPPASERGKPMHYCPVHAERRA